MDSWSIFELKEKDLKVLLCPLLGEDYPWWEDGPATETVTGGGHIRRAWGMEAVDL